MGLSYEDKMNFLSWCKPERKDELLLRIVRGEKVDITKDEDLFFQVNKDRVSLSTFTERDKFKAAAADMKIQKQGMYDKDFGKSKDKKMRWKGDIPAEIYFSRPEFSPLLPREERDANIRKFLNDFPAFRAGDKKI